MDSSSSVSEPPPLYLQLPQKTSVGGEGEGMGGTLNWKFALCVWGGVCQKPAGVPLGTLIKWASAEQISQRHPFQRIVKLI